MLISRMFFMCCLKSTKPLATRLDCIEEYELNDGSSQIHPKEDLLEGFKHNILCIVLGKIHGIAMYYVIFICVMWTKICSITLNVFWILLAQIKSIMYYILSYF